ncbi:MAG: MBL fold metallo-hydrolase [Chloroflexi bacterium]|nr:MBL fold metallo-hydrolase [Chloroflexota bacterium]
MAEVTVLLQGYYLPDPPVRACASIVLVRDGALKILVDPGALPEPGALASRLAEAGVSVDDVGVVFLTHTHVDHCRSLGLFPTARVLDAWGWWEGDTWCAYDGQLSPDTEVIETPGHSDDGLTLLVQTAQGRIAICGDVFFAEMPVETRDLFAVNQTRLAASRRAVLAAADFVIPGHGPMFAVSR